MPYPYTNDLGKTPPKKAYAASSAKSKLQASTNKVKAMSPEEKAAAQKKMMEQLFGANPTTIKFSNVKPINVVQDYKGLAGLYGKPDYNSTPDAPAKLYDSTADFNSKWAEVIDAEIAKIKADKQSLSEAQYSNSSTLAKLDPLLKEVYTDKLIYGTTPSEALKKKLNSLYYGDYNEKLKSKVLGSFGNFEEPMQKVPVKKTQGFFCEWDEKEQAFKLKMEFKVEGLSNVEGHTFVGEQTVSPQFIWGQTNAAEKIVEDMLRQIKVEIMKKMKGGKS